MGAMSIPNGERLFIGDGGLETTMIFREGLELPEFASFTLLEEPSGRDALGVITDPSSRSRRSTGSASSSTRRPGERVAGGGEASAARRHGSPTSTARRSSSLAAIRAEQSAEIPVALCGALGPEGDAYQPANFLTAAEAETYHVVAGRCPRRRRSRAWSPATPSATRRRPSGWFVPPAPRGCRSQSPSRSRPMVVSPTVNPWARRSNGSTPRPQMRPPSSWSTVPTRLTSAR